MKPEPAEPSAEPSELSALLDSITSLGSEEGAIFWDPASRFDGGNCRHVPESRPNHNNLPPHPPHELCNLMNSSPIRWRTSHWLHRSDLLTAVSEHETHQHPPHAQTRPLQIQREVRAHFSVYPHSELLRAVVKCERFVKCSRKKKKKKRLIFCSDSCSGLQTKKQKKKKPPQSLKDDTQRRLITKGREDNCLQSM